MTTEIRPDVAPEGTIVEIEVLVAELGERGVILSVSLSLAGLVSKLVPVMVTTVPGLPIVGVNPVIVVVIEARANDVVLMAEPLGVVMVIGPVVAPVGTVVSIWVAVDDVAVAVTPLNCTVF